MKKMKKILSMLLVGAMVVALGAAAFAGDELEANQIRSSGFYKIANATMPENMTVTVKNSTGSVSAIPANVDGVEGYEWFFSGSERLSVSLTNVTAGTQLVAILVTGSGLPTAANTIAYIDQIAADNDGNASFNILPLLPATSGEMTLYITGNNSFTMKSYTIGYAIEGVYNFLQLGDADMDGKVDPFDALAVLKNYVGSYQMNEFQKVVANVDRDYNDDNSEKVDPFDALLILKKYVGQDVSFDVYTIEIDD